MASSLDRRRFLGYAGWCAGSAMAPPHPTWARGASAPRPDGAEDAPRDLEETGNRQRGEPGGTQLKEDVGGPHGVPQDQVADDTAQERGAAARNGDR